jgi:hypothetical protein
MFFYSADGGEPPHVHVDREASTAKFWLKPVRLCRCEGFGRHELQRIEKIVEANETRLLETWNDFFKRRSAGSNGFGQ